MIPRVKFSIIPSAHAHPLLTRAPENPKSVAFCRASFTRVELVQCWYLSKVHVSGGGFTAWLPHKNNLPTLFILNLFLYLRAMDNFSVDSVVSCSLYWVSGLMSMGTYKNSFCYLALLNLFFCLPNTPIHHLLIFVTPWETVQVFCKPRQWTGKEALDITHYPSPTSTRIFLLSYSLIDT